MDRALRQATGKALTLIAAALEYGGALDAQTFGDMLALFSTIVAETEPDQGDLLASWAGLVRHAAARTDDPAGTPRAPGP